jgi:hypothetical protein
VQYLAISAATQLQDVLRDLLCAAALYPTPSGASKLHPEVHRLQCIFSLITFFTVTFVNTRN